MSSAIIEDEFRLAVIRNFEKIATINELSCCWNSR